MKIWGNTTHHYIPLFLRDNSPKWKQEENIENMALVGKKSEMPGEGCLERLCTSHMYNRTVSVRSTCIFFLEYTFFVFMFPMLLMTALSSKADIIKRIGQSVTSNSRCRPYVRMVIILESQIHSNLDLQRRRHHNSCQRYLVE